MLRYEIIQKLGEGAFGKILEVKDLRNQKYKLAMKVC